MAYRIGIDTENAAITIDSIPPAPKDHPLINFRISTKGAQVIESLKETCICNNISINGGKTTRSAIVACLWECIAQSDEKSDLLYQFLCLIPTKNTISGEKISKEKLKSIAKEAVKNGNNRKYQ